MIYRPARKLADLSPEVARLVLRLGAVLRPRPLSYQEITEAVLRRTEGVWVCPPMVRRVLAGVPGLLTLTDTAASMIGFVSTGSISPDFETGSPPGKRTFAKRSRLSTSAPNATHARRRSERSVSANARSADKVRSSIVAATDSPATRSNSASIRATCSQYDSRPRTPSTRSDSSRFRFAFADQLHSTAPV